MEVTVIVICNWPNRPNRANKPNKPNRPNKSNNPISNSYLLTLSPPLGRSGGGYL